MSTVKVIGGILALAGGGLVLAAVFDLWGFTIELGMLVGYINLIFGICAALGGALALSGKRVGGALALVVGGLMLLFGVLVYMDYTLASEIMPFSYIVYLLSIDLSSILWLITIESMMILAGGILILASGSD